MLKLDRETINFLLEVIAYYLYHKKNNQELVEKNVVDSLFLSFINPLLIDEEVYKEVFKTTEHDVF